MASNWQEDRRYQFAIGVAVIFIGLRWLLTGDLLLFTESFTNPPPEGSTKSTTVVSVIVPMLIEAVVIVGISFLAVSNWVVGNLKQFIAKITQDLSPVPPPVVNPQSVVEQSQVAAPANNRDDGLTEEQIAALAPARAAVAGDWEAFKSAGERLRTNRAIVEDLLRASSLKDQEGIARYTKELTGYSFIDRAIDELVFGADKASKGGV